MKLGRGSNRSPLCSDPTFAQIVTETGNETPETRPVRHLRQFVFHPAPGALLIAKRFDQWGASTFGGFSWHSVAGALHSPAWS